MKINDITPTPLEEPVSVATGHRIFSIGLPKSANPGERRFPLTPEAVKMLEERGFAVKMEKDAARSIHYTDEQYSRCGASITDRDETLRCDIVIHLAPLTRQEIKRMRKGALLLTLFQPCRQDRDAIKALLEKSIISIAIDLIEDCRGNTPFADILSEIDGRAALAIASSLLADAEHGKGILLGGIAGIIPCETMIIGSGIAACAAARSAIGAGTVVRIFDNDVYRLRQATRELGPGAVGSALHPRVMRNALRSADVIVYTEIAEPCVFDSDAVSEMKRGVILFDLTHDCGKAFPSLPTVDLASASPVDVSPDGNTRVCYVNAGSAVPRTAAMALSNTFLTMLSDIVTCEGVTNALKLLPGMQKAAYTFLGKAVNPRIAAIAGVRHVDINIYLTLS